MNFFRSFQSTFYIHSTLIGNFSLSDYYIIYIEDERFFFEESNYDGRFWHTTKTYLIVSENKLKHKVIWSHIKRLWKKFKVFKISLLYLDDLKVLRIFDERFYKYVRARKLNYAINNVKGYPLRVVIFPRITSVICTDYEYRKCSGPDWNILQSFVKKMNYTLKITTLVDKFGFGRFVKSVYYINISKSLKE